VTEGNRIVLYDYDDIIPYDREKRFGRLTREA